MNKGIHILKAAAATVLAMITGCATVDYTGNEFTPTETFVRYSLDWEGQSEVPAEMTLAMSRIVNAVHFSCLMDSLGTMTAVLRDSTMTPGDTLTGIMMPNGEYYMVAFNSNPTSYGISGYDSFVSDKSHSMRDILVTAPAYTEEESALIIGDNVADFNPTQTYIKSISPVFIDVQKINIHPEIDTLVNVRPVRITQDLTFRIVMETDNEVEIKSVNAEISGVPGSVRLMTCQVSDTTTHRVPFTMERKTRGTGTETYEGRITVLGLFPSTDASFITGPGILHLSIHAEAEGHKRVFRVGINIKQSITDAGLMEKVSESERLYRISKPEQTIDISSRLKINKGQVVLDGDKQGVEDWFENEDLEFEI